MTFFKINALISVSIVFFYFSGLKVCAQPVFFEKNFGGTGAEVSTSIKQLSSGSVFLLGTTDSGSYGGYDISLSKLRNDGQLLWTKFYGTTENEYSNNLFKTSDECFVYSSMVYNITGDIDGQITKVDSNGIVLWSEKIKSSVNESITYVGQTSDGGYAACGFRNDTSGGNDFLVVKMDDSGNVQWLRTYGRPDNDYAKEIYQLPDGGYIVTGDTKSFGSGGYDVELLRLDSLGNVIWNYAYGNSFQNGCQGLLVTSAGKYLSYGETEIFNASPFNHFFELIDENGTSLWRKTFGGSGTDAVFSVLETPDRGFIATGYTNSQSHGNSPLDLVIFKTDSAGNLEWSKYFGSPNIDIGYEIIAEKDSGYLVTGLFSGVTDQYYLLHIDANGIVGDKEYETLNKSLKVYPNPANEMVTIDCMDGEQGILNLFSSDGRLVLSNYLTCPDQLNLASFPPGLYQMVFNSKNKRYLNKIVVK